MNANTLSNASVSSLADRREDTALRRRTLRWLKTEISFIPNASFPSHQGDILQEAESCLRRDTSMKPPKDLPPHLARLCEARLLSSEEEMRLFRVMNLLKFRANQLRSRLDPDRPVAGTLTEIEQCLQAADAVRDRIIRANMRLVISVVKKFVTPQHSFDDLLSDGTYSLMQAVEKFDYDRGFRFSTYAYRAIARNACRRISDSQRELSQYVSGPDELLPSVPDEGSTVSMNEETWQTLRRVLSNLMHHLDRRERFIVRGRYALGAHRKAKTFQKLADKLGVSKERVRQLEQRAVAKLQALAAEIPLDDLVAPAAG